jgi:hypothetical protein
MKDEFFILGLDVSTSVVGVTILNQNFDVILMTHVNLGKIKEFWAKVDHIHNEIEKLFSSYQITETYIEEPANRFSAGMSSSHTINTLIKFNALVSWKVRSVSKEPHHVTAAEARKKCGMVLHRVSKVGVSHKQQVFDQITGKGGLLQNVTIPRTKTGKVDQTFYDEIDSYVIARTGVLVHKAQHTK